MDDRTRYDAAFDAMLRGDVTDAAAGFATVAQTANDPQLRAQAAELGRLAHELALRHARLTFDGSPGAPGGPATVTTGNAVVTGVSEDDEPTGGRATFVVTTTMASLYSGVVLLDLLDVGDVRTGVIIVMGSTAAGVIGSIYGTRGKTMTGGMADSWELGMFAGAGNALLLSGPLGFYSASSNASEKVQSLTLGAAWGGATAGLLIADHYRPTRAQVNITQTFGLMGLGSTLLGLALIQPGNLDSDSFLTITAAGLDAGIGIGASFASKLDWSLSRARYVSLSAFLGLLAGGGTSLLIFADSNDGDRAARASAAIALAGLWGGFFVGMHLTSDMAPDYRFRARAGAPATSTMVTPAILRDTASSSAPGLALVGTFK
jgi:hypothetical protein